MKANVHNALKETPHFALIWNHLLKAFAVMMQLLWHKDFVTGIILT